MTPIEVLELALKQAEQARDIADTEDRYARAAHIRAQNKFSDAVDRVKALNHALEVLKNQ